MRVNILEARNQLSQLIKRAQAGEEVIIANRGEPVARLEPIRQTQVGQKPAQGTGKAILEWLDSHPLPEYARRTSEEIDADIEEQRASWD
jgi:prevent-host-death family protein